MHLSTNAVPASKNNQMTNPKKGSEEMEQIGECLEYENKSPEPRQGSIQSVNNYSAKKYKQKEFSIFHNRFRLKILGVTLDDSYGLTDALNKTPKRQEGIKIYYQDAENSKHYSPNAYNSKSPYYKKPSIVQTPSRANPLDTRVISKTI